MYSLEANSNLIETIQTNQILNNPGTNYCTINKAIDYSGENKVAFNIYENNLSGNVSNSKSDKKMFVPGVKLNDILKQFQIEKFILICDIEGSEAGLLIKDKEALKNCVQMIIELHQTTFEGIHYSVNDQKKILINEHKFKLSDRYGNVFVFDK